MSNPQTQIQFEQAGSQLTAVEIVRGGRSPLIASLHRALLALGIVVSSYQVRTGAAGLTERIVLERRDGGSIEAQLSDATKTAILQVANGGTGAVASKAVASNAVASKSVALGDAPTSGDIASGSIAPDNVAGAGVADECMAWEGLGPTVIG